MSAAGRSIHASDLLRARVNYCAAQAAFPWAPEVYPGLLKGMFELLGGRAAIRTVLDWRRGRRRPPIWAIEVLQDALRSRGRNMLEIADQLEEERQPPEPGPHLRRRAGALC
jgi:hypothetical protein